MAKDKKDTGPNITDVVGVDFGSTSTKLVRIRRSGQGFTLVDADVLPPFDLSEDAEPQKISLSKKLMAPYAAACVAGRDSHVRFMFVSSKLQDNKSIQSRVSKSLGLGNDFRVGYSIVERGQDGMDHKVLAAGLPTREVNMMREFFVNNKPSLIHMEIAGLSALSSFSHSPAVQGAEGIVCYLEGGAESTLLSFFLGGELRLVRKFDHGANYIQSRIQDVLNLSEDDALTILFEDAAPLLDQQLDPIGTLLQEISISRKFVERNENSRIEAVYASGGLSYSPYWTYMMTDIMGAEIQIWNPFLLNGMKNLPKGVLGVESMFAPAVGAALAALRGHV